MKIIVDPQIAETARAGDHLAFEKIVLLLEKAVYNYFYRLVSNKEIAEDLTQETFIKVYLNIKSLKVQGNVTSWIFTIATNTVRDWFRKYAKKQELPFDEKIEVETSKEELTSKYIDDTYLREEVLKSLDKIKPLYRSVLLMHYFYEQSYEEISGVLNLPVNTVKTYVRRAKQSLKEIIDQSKVN